MTPIENYRLIRLEPAAPLDGQADAAIAFINGRFAPDDFRLVRNGVGLEVRLRQVDVAALREAVEAASDRYGAAPLMRQVVGAVEGIKSYGVNGGKRLYVGYNRERKVTGRKAKEQRRGKHYYANDHDFGREANALPPEFTDRIVCGDSEDVLKQLPDNCVDLVFTSPPYNFGLGYEGADAELRGDAMDWEAYFAKLFRVFDECVRVLKFGGRIAVNVQPLFSDYIPSHHVISNYFMAKRLIWKGEILWEKNNYNCKYTAWGSWKSPASPYLKYTWEFVEVFAKGNLKKEGAPSDADIDADSFKEWVSAKWSIAPERRMREFGHPAMFPEELARRVMLLFSFRGDVVLDPFAGVGTTCVAARAVNRRYLGVDVAPEYCATAERRLSTVQPEGLLAAGASA
ncbi:MAG: site-specific DNA-methyltransferase [Chloroflexota bacterium]|nr:site-specific DNA-methyltransferase [Chloroflexota bacterium]